MGDGYGLLYETKPTENVTVMVGGKTYTLEAKSQIEVIAVSKGENKTCYRFLCLPIWCRRWELATASTPS